MDFLSSLQCKTEPFASPSGSEIFLCQGIRDSIEKLSHHVHLGAGLQLVIGDNGSGKTTLLNQLAQKFSDDKKAVVLLLNNPQFTDLQQFLITLAGIFKTIKAPSGFDDEILQEAFNNFFYKLCQQEKKIVLLLIDNGQNLPDFCLHALNSFYKQHPDSRRLLQTVICGEPSFLSKINADKALSSQVFLTTTPKPFRFNDTRKFIRFHLEHAAADPGSPPALFSIPAQWAVYLLTRGQPQKTIDLCHSIVLTLIAENRKKADWYMALRSGKLLFPGRAKKLQIVRTASVTSFIVLVLVLGLWSKQIKTMGVSTPEQTKEAEPELSPTIQEKPPLIIPAEAQPTGVGPSEKSAAFSNQPEAKNVIAGVSVPGSAKVAATASESQPGPELVPEPQVEPPEYLGDIITAPGETLGDMVRRIYGPWSFNPENVKTVLAANPDFKNPELLSLGYKIRFPAIPVALTPEADEVWWVRITALDNIQSAYRFLRKYRKSSPPLLIIPSRDDSGQVLMNILLEEYFMDKKSAQIAINALPAAITAQAETLHGLSPATFYYQLQQNN